MTYYDVCAVPQFTATATGTCGRELSESFNHINRSRAWQFRLDILRLSKSMPIFRYGYAARRFGKSLTPR